MQTYKGIAGAVVLFFGAATVHGQDMPTIAEKTEGFVQRDGFFSLYWDAAAGRVYLEIEAFEEDFLYVSSLTAGLGSNDIGLDRGQLGATRLVRLERIGNKVLLVRRNLRYRAESTNAHEQSAVRDAFAEGILWGFEIAAEEDGRVLVDATDFIVRDVHGAARTLRAAGQGSYSLERSRSAPVPEMLRSFPRNTEMEARITLVGESPGSYVREVAADPFAVTLRIRHSFVMLPEPGYEPRAFHPGSGYGTVTYRDYATPVGEDLVRRYIRRHRLVKQDSTLEVSDPVEPITYYLDPGTPEPVRTALLDGARWWAGAFEAAGFTNAFEVQLLPEGADPMDIRYNVIQWVHRATRGWSYGSSVTDPRTGEIIKGHVTLGSLRVRQDYLIAEGLLAPYEDANATGVDLQHDPMLRMALARIRQLSAHEVGHTLGLSHNFAASYSGRASVMDYPAPLATVTEAGTISLEEAYAPGLGAWDSVAIAFGYAQPLAGQADKEMLTGILDGARARGLQYITDADARPGGSAHPAAHLWDNGDDMVIALQDEMQVRRIALERFGVGAVRSGRPLAMLEEALVPLYLRHRYQVEATAKLLGGVSYSYAVKGGSEPLPEAVPAATQRSALSMLTTALQPEALRLPENIRTQLPPRPPGFGQHRELFPGHTGLTFDPYAPAAAVAGLVLSTIVHPERAARLSYQQDFDSSLPDFKEVLEVVSSATWGADVPRGAYDAELQRVVQQVWVDELVDLSANERAAPAARAMATQKLHEIRGWLVENPGPSRDIRTVAHRGFVMDQLDRYLAREYRVEEGQVPLSMPPGSPIGSLERKRHRDQFLAGMPDAGCEAPW